MRFLLRLVCSLLLAVPVLAAVRPDPAATLRGEWAIDKVAWRAMALASAGYKALDEKQKKAGLAELEASMAKVPDTTFVEFTADKIIVTGGDGRHEGTYKVTSVAGDVVALAKTVGGETHEVQVRVTDANHIVLLEFGGGPETDMPLVRRPAKSK
jgi:hypothetical protein